LVRFGRILQSKITFSRILRQSSNLVVFRWDFALQNHILVEFSEI